VEEESVNAVLTGPEAAMDTFAGLRTLGNLSLDLNRFVACIDDGVVDLTYHEIELLRLFFDNEGRVLPFEFWARGVLGRTDESARRHLAVLVHRLRNKIAGSWPYVIETVRGRGYGLVVGSRLNGGRPQRRPRMAGMGGA
jgi:DNA-binding response OmpR family regulator